MKSISGRPPLASSACSIMHPMDWPRTRTNKLWPPNTYSCGKNTWIARFYFNIYIIYRYVETIFETTQFWNTNDMKTCEEIVNTISSNGVRFNISTILIALLTFLSRHIKQRISISIKIIQIQIDSLAGPYQIWRNFLSITIYL